MALVLTADGSHTLKLQDADEHYHSTHGALQESQHVFVQNGASRFEEKDRLRILEVGFGTGANALLTALWAAKFNVLVKYLGLEKFPLDAETVKGLNYPEKLGGNAEQVFQAMHACNWGQSHRITPDLELEKLAASVNDLKAEAQFDLIYFDAFGPRTQPEMWTLEVFEKMFRALLSGGVLVTYCAKGQVRRDLQTAGFEVERLSGPPGKREMLRATKP